MIYIRRKNNKNFLINVTDFSQRQFEYWDFNDEVFSVLWHIVKLFSSVSLTSELQLRIIYWFQTILVSHYQTLIFDIFRNSRAPGTSMVPSKTNGCTHGFCRTFCRVWLFLILNKSLSDKLYLESWSSEKFFVRSRTLNKLGTCQRHSWKTNQTNTNLLPTLLIILLRPILNFFEWEKNAWKLDLGGQVSFNSLP